MKRSVRTGLIVGGGIGLTMAIVAVTLGGRSSAAVESPPPPDEEPIPAPPKQPPIGKVGGLGTQGSPPAKASNWGATPAALRQLFARAEAASKIPGLGQFLAAWAWDAFRGEQSHLSAATSKVVSDKSPAWGQLLHDDSPAAAKASREALQEMVALTLVEPTHAEDWADWGRGGLFGLLAGEAVHGGGLDDYLPETLDLVPDIGMLGRANAVAMATGLVRRVLVDQPTVMRATSAQTWRAVYRVLHDLPPAPTDPKVRERLDRFALRAERLGIKLDSIANPTPASLAAWPGAAAVWEAITS